MSATASTKTHDPLAPVGTVYHLRLHYDVTADAWLVEQSDDFGYRPGIYLSHRDRASLAGSAEYRLETGTSRDGTPAEAIRKCPNCDTRQPVGAALVGTLANREYLRCRNCQCEWGY